MVNSDKNRYYKQAIIKKRKRDIALCVMNCLGLLVRKVCMLTLLTLPSLIGGIIAHHIGPAEIMTQQIEMGRYRAAATKAIDICIERGILKNFLVERKTEVVGTMIRMFDQVEQTILYGEERFEDGLQKGREEGFEMANRMQAELKDKMRRAGELPMFLEALGNREKMVELYERFDISCVCTE